MSYLIQYDASAFHFSARNVPLESLAGVNLAQVESIRDLDIDVELTRDEMESLVQYAQDLAEYEEDGWEPPPDGTCLACHNGDHEMSDITRRCECACHCKEAA